MEKVFFSDSNINNQTLRLMNALGAKDGPDARKKCRMLMVKNMKDGYIKYKDVQKKMPTKDFIDKLNKKCIENCLGYCQQRKYERDANNIDRVSRRRDHEINGDRNLMLQNRGEFTSQKKDRDSNINQPKFLNSGNGIGGTDFATFNPDIQGGYVSASGEIKHGQLVVNGNDNGNQNQDMRIGKMSMGRGRQDELERRMGELQGSYQGGNMNQRPPDINFALDGSDTRARNISSTSNPQIDFDQFQGLDSFGSRENTGSNFNNNVSIDDIMGFNPYNQSNNMVNNTMGNMTESNNQMQQMMQMMMKMMQQNQQSQPNQTQNNFGDNIDVKTRLNNLMNERSNIDNISKQNNKGKQFDPTKSPHEMGSFFFEQGQKIIDGLNAEVLSSMNSKQIDFLIDLYKSIIVKNKQIKIEKNLKNCINIKNKDTDTSKNDIINIPHETKILKINSDNYNNNSDFNIDFEEIKNITSLSIIKTKFPEFSENINNNANTFSIKINDNNSKEDNSDDGESSDFDTFVLDNGNYTISTILKKLQDALDAKKLDIKIMYNKNKHIEIKSNTEFEIKYYDDSILKHLGFTKEYYSGKSSYIGEHKPNMNIFKYVDVYINFNNTNTSEKFATIDLSDSSNNHYPIIKKIKKQNINNIGIMLTAHDNKDIIYKFNKKFKMELGLCE